jgi:hypothetical protein
MMVCNTPVLTLAVVKSGVVLSARHQVWEETVFSGMNGTIDGTGRLFYSGSAKHFRACEWGLVDRVALRLCLPAEPARWTLPITQVANGPVAHTLRWAPEWPQRGYKTFAENPNGVQSLSPRLASLRAYLGSMCDLYHLL